MKIHFGNFPRGIDRLVEKINESGQLTDQDLSEIELLSSIRLKTDTSDFYERTGLLLESKPSN